MKSSYSQNNTYITCPQFWDWSYVKKLKSPDQSAALYFGSAVDDAIMANLEEKDNSDFLTCDIYQIFLNSQFNTSIIIDKNLIPPRILTCKIFTRAPPA